MSHSHSPADKAIRVYSRLLMLYPQSFREAFGAQMVQTFKDHCNDVLGTKGHLGVGFWVGVISDESKNIMEEQITLLKSHPIATTFLLVIAALFAVIAIALSKVVQLLVVGLLLILAIFFVRNLLAI